VLSAFPALPGLWYTIGKEQAQFGQLEAARAALKQECELDAGLKRVALDDFELEEVWKWWARRSAGGRSLS
jgi:hypothetical protein